MTCGEREEGGSGDQTIFFLNKNYESQLDSDTCPHKIILTSLPVHLCL